MSRIQYACIIKTDTTLNAPEFGLFNGVFAFIDGNIPFNSGSPTTGAPKPIGFTAAQTDFATGMLAEQGFDGFGYSADLKTVGGYAAMTSGSVCLTNLPNLSEGVTFMEFLRQKQVYLYRRPVWFYVVTFDDANVATFHQWNYSSIENVSYNETEVTLSLIDCFKDIHQDFPRTLVSQDEFPFATDDARKDPLPVCLGYVSHASLRDLSGLGEALPLYSGPTGVFTETTSRNYDAKHKSMFLKTGGIKFTAGELAGAHMMIMNDTAQTGTFLIQTNDASGATKGLEAFTRITLTTWFGSGVKYFADGTTNAWKIRIMEQRFVRVCSDGPVFSFPALSPEYYRDESKRFLEMHLSSVVELHPEGLPGYSRRGGIASASLYPYQPAPNSITRSTFLPSQVQYAGINIIEENGDPLANPNLRIVRKTFPDVRGSAGFPKLGKLIQSDPNASYSVTIGSMVYDHHHHKLLLNVYLPDYVDAFDYTSAFVEVGGSIAFNVPINPAPPAAKIYPVKNDSKTQGIIASLAIEVTPIDVYGNRLPPTSQYTGTGFSGGNAINSVKGSIFAKAPVAKNSEWSFHNVAFSERISDVNDTDDSAFSQKTQFGAAIRSAGGSKYIDYLEVGLDLGIEGWDNTYKGQSFTFTLDSIGLTFDITAPPAVPDLFIQTIGESYRHQAWRGLRNLKQPVLGIPDIMEHIIRVKDCAPDFVNDASFLAASALRPATGKNAWIAGMQVTEQKNSAEYLDDLCRHIHAVLVPGPDGRRSLKTWFAGLTAKSNLAGYPLLDESRFLADSLQDVGETEQGLCYSEFSLHFDKNAKTGEFDGQLAVHNTDHASFPDEFPTPEPAYEAKDFISWGYDSASRRIAIRLSAGPPLSLGAIVQLSAPGWNSGDRPILEIGPSLADAQLGLSVSIAYIAYQAGDVISSNAFPRATLSLKLRIDAVDAWETWVVGVDDYKTAREIWNNCREGFEITRNSNVLDLELPWFPDPIDWDVETEVPAPVKLLQELSNYLTKPKRVCRGKLPINAANLSLGIADTILFRDQKLSFGKRYYGWIADLSLDTEENSLEVEILWFPWIDLNPDILMLEECSPSQPSDPTTHWTPIVMTMENNDPILLEGISK